MYRWLPLGLMVLALVVGCGDTGGHRPPSPPALVSVSKVDFSNAEDFEDFTGRTEAKDYVEVKARVTGYLLKVNFEEGKLVKANDVLFEIDDRTYKADLAKAEGEVGRHQATQDRLRSDLARARKMRIGDAISREEYDKIAGNVEEASASAAAAKAAAERFKLDVGFTKVRAPISGRVSRTLITPGNLVTADSTKLTTVVSMDPIYAYFDVDERTVLRIQKLVKEGKFAAARESKVPVYLGTQIEKGFPHAGFINFVDNRIDPSTGTLRVRGEFPNADASLTPGLFARIRLPLGEKRKALVVSEKALGTDQGERFVYVVTEDNTVKYRPVTVGSLRDGMRVVESGLKAGERIITNGLQRVRPEAKVEAKDVPMPGPTNPGIPEKK